MSDKTSSITIYTGPMFAGKTSALIRALSFFPSDARTLVYKPNIDNRYSKVEIVSHDGKSAAATAVDVDPSKWPNLPEIEILIVDEVQFFLPTVAYVLREYAERGVQVITGGLEADYLGKTFKTTQRLMSFATKHHRLYAECERCGKQAGNTMRKNESDEGKRIQVGGAESYAAVCNQHFVVH